MARTTLKSAKLHANQFINDVRANKITYIDCPKCARCGKRSLVPSDIMEMSRTGRCGFCQAMMGLKPDERAHVEYVVYEARHGNFAPMIEATAKANKEKCHGR